MAAGRGAYWRGRGVGTRSPPPRDAGSRTTRRTNVSRKIAGHYHDVCGIALHQQQEKGSILITSCKPACQRESNQHHDATILGKSNLYCNTNKAKSHVDTIEVLVIIRIAD